MFVLKEIEKIIDEISNPNKTNQIKANEFSNENPLPNLNCKPVEQLSFINNLTPLRQPNDSPTYLKTNHLTLDTLNEYKPPDCDNSNRSAYDLIEITVYKILLESILKIQPSQYPTARLVICDENSFKLLARFRKLSLGSKHVSLYSYPACVSAILPAKDIIDLFKREQTPLFQLKDKNFGSILTQKKTFETVKVDYRIIKKLFPYLKHTDLLLLNFRIANQQTNPVNSSLNSRMMQCLASFARSVKWINLGDSTVNFTWIPHPIYNNVMYFDLSENNDYLDTLISGSSPIQLSAFANRVYSFIEKCNLISEDIYYSKNDLFDQTKLVASIIYEKAKTNVKARQTNVNQVTNSKNRLIVLSRYYDVRIPLAHSDYYGPFIEQEVDNINQTENRFSNNNELDSALQFCKLEEVLPTIIRYSLLISDQKNQVTNESKKQSFVLSMVAAQSVQKHLVQSRLLYECLSQGYQIFINIEKSLMNLASKILNLNINSKSRIDDLIIRFNRCALVCKKISDINLRFIKPIDVVRLICILRDVASILSNICDRGQQSSLNNLMNEVDRYVFNKTVTTNISDDTTVIQYDAKDFQTTYQKYKKLSETIKDMQSKSNMTDLLLSAAIGDDMSKSFAQIAESKEAVRIRSEKINLIIIFIGGISNNELASIKLLERDLTRENKIGQIVVMSDSCCSYKTMIANDKH